ncbi:MAG: POTRA domain-containing protein [Cyanobacteriota bacterium]|nr:POTRA domain-containing protein [Cyanobacteriota bacterium]
MNFKGVDFEFPSRWYGGIVLLSLNLLFPLMGAQPILSTPFPSLVAQTPSDADASPEESEPERQVLIAEVVLRGAEGEIAEEIYGVIRTKAGETTTRSQLREDVNAIFALGYFRNVQTLPEDTEIGVRVTFEIVY